MEVTRNPHMFINSMITIDDSVIERVSLFRYLGTWLHEDWESGKEIKCRIEAASTAFSKYRSILTNKEFNLDLRIRFVKCYVWTVLLYGVESWTLKVEAMNRLEAFEMWLYRRILRIPWTDKVTNEEVSYY